MQNFVDLSLKVKNIKMHGKNYQISHNIGGILNWRRPNIKQGCQEQTKIKKFPQI